MALKVCDSVKLLIAARDAVTAGPIAALFPCHIYSGRQPC